MFIGFLGAYFQILLNMISYIEPQSEIYRYVGSIFTDIIKQIEPQIEAWLGRHQYNEVVYFTY